MNSMLSDHNGIKLENNNRKISGKSPNISKLHNTFLNNLWVKEETKGKIESIYFKLNENENSTFQKMTLLKQY